ncbi:helix-turn-helix domain-containing protein [Silvimonas terrae]|uniref:helix-turn-helix domain-containing protein n=1 Tax=Silvimonas terrae TaxID=300266 RepID=UPI001615BCE2|nr:helix-turn-helix transcriptional regulator [Silvimonas terrae]
MKRVSGLGEERLPELVLLGAAIRKMRKQCGLSQEALADAAGVDRSHMGKIERGERNVTILNVLRIARALGYAPSRLLEEAGL